MTLIMTTNRRDTRRLAMQALYQIDLRGEGDVDAVREGFADDAESGSAESVNEACDLAVAAWGCREQADAMCTELAPDWPSYRQPPVDRAILRLAYYEMVSGRVPVKVAINEAVELGKRYGSEHSPPFLNGVLDKLARQLTKRVGESREAPVAEPDGDG